MRSHQFRSSIWLKYQWKNPFPDSWNPLTTYNSIQQEPKVVDIRLFGISALKSSVHKSTRAPTMEKGPVVKSHFTTIN